MVNTLIIIVCDLNPDFALIVNKGETFGTQGLIYKFVPPKDQFCFKILVLILIGNLKRNKTVERPNLICEGYVFKLKPYFRLLRAFNLRESE